MEKLEDRWKKFTLTEVKDNEVKVNEQILDEEAREGDISLVGKLLVEIIVNKEVIRTTMVKARKPTKVVTVTEIKTNLFIFSFECSEDKQRVINGRP